MPNYTTSNVLNPLGATVRATGDDGSKGVSRLLVNKLQLNSGGYSDSTRSHSTSSYKFLGAGNNTVFVNDSTGGVLRQSVDNGTNWSTSKTLPTNVTYAALSKILYFKGYLYLLAKDTSDNITKVWRSLPTTGNTALSWSAPVMAYLTAGASGIYTAIDKDDTYLYLAEYGDPTSGPTAWRSADGETWDIIYTETDKSPAQRHIHAIAPDPYNAGHLWMTLGDGTASRSVLMSTDYGDTWVTAAASSIWQSVQISFTEDYVFMAGDSQRSHLVLVDKTTNETYHACAGAVKNIAVPTPASVTDSFYYNGYFGVVDPSTGAYYFVANDSSSGGNVCGLFIIPSIGSQPILIEKYTSIQAPIDIYNGVLWLGFYHRNLNTYK